jgi:hypothetical protein
MRSKHAAWLLLALAACNRSPQSQSPQAAMPATTTAPAIAASTELHDISERGPHYMIGISFPPELKRYPALAAEVRRDADAVRADFLKQAGDNAAAGASGMFDLSLAYSMVAETPRIVAVAAEGTSYVGGAHGAPLLERYVWLLPENRRLTASDLIPDAANWKPVSDYVSSQLMALQQQRLGGEDKTGDNAGDAADDAADHAASEDAAARKEQLKNAADMIEQGTEPKAENFANFEPILGQDGKITALRFVFPPYQVGPYSDGTQTVEVPAAVLLPHIAPAERGLFAGG